MFCFFPLQRTVIDGEPCLLDILDTAGQVEFTAMREQYMRGGEGFIICYSVADKHSFLEAEEYRNLILKVRETLSVAQSKGAFTNDVRTEEEGGYPKNKHGKGCCEDS